MKVVTTREELRAARRELAGSVGFVPTMGYLHDGHLSLVRRAQSECDAVVVSIFVNPTQFGPGEDLEAYPRDPERDLALLRDAGVDVVWMPRVADVYPEGFATTVQVAGVTEVLEGERRPGHFAGVTTVVTILTSLVRADVLFVGQKDLQQSVVLRRLVADLGIADRVVVCPTGRESDGLASSSRNTYLRAEERPTALLLAGGLRAARAAWARGERDADRLREIVCEIVDVPGTDVDYVSVADPDTLAELHGPVERAAVSLAVRVGRPRLIDNTLLHEEDAALG